MKIKPLLSSMLTLSLFISLSTQASVITQIKPNYVSSNYAQTKYPIVLAHGMGGFSRIGTDTLGLDYWYQIAPDLARNGTNVWTTRVSPFNSTEVRGEQLLQQVEEILALTGKEKVNLLGHSHGGPTARYVAGIIPTKVASVTAVASPQKGSTISDLILSLEDTPLKGPVVAVVNIISASIVWAQGLDQKQFPSDALAGAKSLNTAGATEFSRKFPMGVSANCNEGAYQEKGISFYSFQGNRLVTNIFDPDSAMGLTGLLMGGEGDGLVSTCSGRLGKTIRNDYAWNHFDEVNQVLGLRGLFSQDPVQVYREHANRLKSQGL
ncbi:MULTISPECIES: esterase/lipase family protein [Acinetobacter]|uniref:Triacylglycerol lipase n=1 Tax=Acinetobacter wuhouensis TaxID=1879050 RepID=A0A4Q7AJZ8_9GAMM|nr:triacylglycerol lipase [Acinetobacter wuhouensis]RZG74367.1 triacylglycerol lipase [Acinetobacter sp. WCHAc060025]